MIFFSSLAFTVLESAMSVIFLHRVVARKRRFIFSVLIPYVYILSLGIGLLLVTLVAGSLQAVGKESVDLFGQEWSLHGVSGLLLYLLGVAGEIFVLTSVYLVMPAGRLAWRHALIGGITATVLWEITRHVLVWYLATLSQVNVVYGSLTTAIVVLLSLEVGATLLLLRRAGDLGVRAARPPRGSAGRAGLHHGVGLSEQRRGSAQDASSAPTRSRRPAGEAAAAGTGSPATRPTRLNRPRRNGLAIASAAGAREERAPEVLQRHRHHRAPGSTLEQLHHAALELGELAVARDRAFGEDAEQVAFVEHLCRARERLLRRSAGSTFCGAIGIALARRKNQPSTGALKMLVVHDEADRPRARRHQQHRRRRSSRGCRPASPRLRPGCSRRPRTLKR